MDELADQYAAISLEEEESGGLSYEAEEALDGGIDTRWCLVGRFLSDRSIDFEKMQHSMATLWKPGKGVYIKRLEPNLFLFQFNHEVDINRVIEGSPWTYDRMQLVFERLKEGDNPRFVEINKLDFWVQLHDLQPGFMSERVCKEVGNYIGEFLESDGNNFIGVWRDYLRIRVRMQIDKPIKRHMKIKKSGSDWFWVNFKYEHIPTFCFICGLLGHAEKFCSKIFETPIHEIVKPYGPWMKAIPRRQQYLTGSKWLRSSVSVQPSPAKEGDLTMGAAGMDEDDSGKKGTANPEPNPKGYDSVKKRRVWYRGGKFGGK
ncbi:hypothetical protein DCAR_0101008 [Daucus carota subsp. sativus]|uniref:CCHC-type domain-containing protein n=1 Tax=Daucus carota subsp. sativus TaxID=79200 RepID=A0AAF1AEU7_DAUCS|nr:hypothetical protein DCAR_0101008 [Daucus carota subsp. sativus]